MAKQSSKGFASKGNNVPYVKDTGKATVHDATGSIVGKSGGIESPAPGNLTPKSKTPDIGELVDVIKEHNLKYRPDLVSRGFHPDGTGNVISTASADVPIVKGEVASYQLSTGDIIEL